MDELFERNNSLKIQNAKAQVAINEQQSIVRDVTKSEEERLAAVEKILEIENELARTKEEIAAQEQEAAYRRLLARTGLGKEELKSVIDQYNLNRDLFLQAEKYNELLDRRAEAEKAIKRTNRLIARQGGSDGGLEETLQNEKQVLQSIEEQIAARSTEEIQEAAKILRQYNLSNDDMVLAYVNATEKMIMAREEQSRLEATMATRRGRLVNQMNAADQEAADKAYSDAKTSAETAYRQQLNDLKQSLLDREISQEEYNDKALQAEVARLESIRQINLQYGKDITEIDGQILDARLKQQENGCFQYVKFIKFERNSQQNLLQFGQSPNCLKCAKFIIRNLNKLL